MREGNPVASPAVSARPARRLRLATPATALVLGGDLTGVVQAAALEPAHLALWTAPRE
jgi:hypothetical protein